MYEDILAIVLLDKAKPFCIVKPFYLALCHFHCLLLLPPGLCRIYVNAEVYRGLNRENSKDGDAL